MFIHELFFEDVIYDICKTIMIERRPAWDVVIRQNDPGDTYVYRLIFFILVSYIDFFSNRFYIILQGSVNIYRLDDDSPPQMLTDFDTITEFSKLDTEPEQRDELITQTFGNYIVTLGIF